MRKLILDCLIWGAAQNADIYVIVKIESADSIPNLQSILEASDGVSGLSVSGAFVPFS